MVSVGLRWSRMMCLVSDGFQPWQSFPATPVLSPGGIHPRTCDKSVQYIDLCPQQCLCKFSKTVDTHVETLTFEGFEAELFVVSFCLAGHREFELDD